MGLKRGVAWDSLANSKGLYKDQKRIQKGKGLKPLVLCADTTPHSLALGEGQRETLPCTSQVLLLF